jgi:hypothetical protein
LSDGSKLVEMPVEKSIENATPDAKLDQPHLIGIPPGANSNFKVAGLYPALIHDRRVSGKNFQQDFG